VQPSEHLVELTNGFICLLTFVALLNVNRPPREASPPLGQSLEYNQLVLEILIHHTTAVNLST
jgi:hypothetical protein